MLRTLIYKAQSKFINASAKSSKMIFTNKNIVTKDFFQLIMDI